MSIGDRANVNWGRSQIEFDYVPNDYLLEDVLAFLLVASFAFLLVMLPEFLFLLCVFP